MSDQRKRAITPRALARRGLAVLPPCATNGQRLSRGAKNTVIASSAYDSRIGTPKACNSPAQGGARSRMRPRRHPGFSASMNPGTPTVCDKCTPCRTLAGCVDFGLPTQGAPLTRRCLGWTVPSLRDDKNKKDSNEARQIWTTLIPVASVQETAGDLRPAITRLSQESHLVAALPRCGLLFQMRGSEWPHCV